MIIAGNIGATASVGPTPAQAASGPAATGRTASGERARMFEHGGAVTTGRATRKAIRFHAIEAERKKRKRLHWILGGAAVLAAGAALLLGGGR